MTAAGDAFQASLSVRFLDDAEDLAAAASAESGLDDRPNADPELLAVGYCGLQLVPSAGRGSRLVGRWVVFPRTAPLQSRAYFVAHEVMHHLIRDERWKIGLAARLVGVEIAVGDVAVDLQLRLVHLVGTVVTTQPLDAAAHDARDVPELASGARLAGHVAVERVRLDADLPRDRLQRRVLAGAARDLRFRGLSDAASLRARAIRGWRHAFPPQAIRAG